MTAGSWFSRRSAAWRDRHTDTRGPVQSIIRIAIRTGWLGNAATNSRAPRIIGLKHVLRRDWIVFMSAATAKPCWHILLLRFEHLIKLDVAFLHEFIHLLRHRPDLLRHWVTFAVG